MISKTQKRVGVKFHAEYSTFSFILFE